MKLWLLAIAVGISCRAQTPAFEAASVRLNKSGGNTQIRPEPGRLTITSGTLKAMVRYAYQVQDLQISGGPAWFDSDHWDVSATAGRAASAEELRAMLRALLEERFRMNIRRETKELPVYALIVAKGGSKLSPSTDEKPERVMLQAKGGLLTMIGQDVSLPKIAQVLFGVTGRMVIDRTEIKGNFDYKLEWVPDATNMPSINGAKMEASADGASIFTAVQEQLGLKLESTKGPVEVIVVESAEKAAEN